MNTPPDRPLGSRVCYRSPMDDSLPATPGDRIRSEEVRAIYRNTPPGMLATLGASLVITGILIGSHALHWQVGTTFVCVMLVQCAGRGLLYRAYWQATPSAADWYRWARYFSIGTLTAGLVVGLGAMWLMPPDRFDMQLIVLLLIFATAAGAVSAYSAYTPALYAFLVPAIGFPAIWLAMRGDPVHYAVSGCCAMWFVSVAEQARRFHRTFHDSVRLRFQNEDLVADLRREKLSAEEASAAKSRFLAAASHDLRQPVHALSLFLAALRPKTTDTQAHRLLDYIDESVSAMGGLFGGLLDISRLDAGVVEVNLRALAIQPLLERICNDYRGEAAAKGISLTLMPCSLAVRSDPLLLERVIRNIVANAVTYTERGRVVVGCRRGTRLSIEVWDTGCGIPPDRQEHVFQEFFQLGNPERDRTKGVGLGLAIVRRLTTLLAHPLQLSSRLGVGSTFRVSVPLASPAEIMTAPTEEMLTRTMAKGTGLILFVDDEPAIQLAMQRLLQDWGYETLVAGSGAEMLERIASCDERPALIICDYRLRAHETGITVIQRLRTEYNHDIPGMLLTGDTAPDRLKEAQESGLLLLHKPTQNSRLRAAINNLIRASLDEEGLNQREIAPPAFGSPH